MADLSSSAAGGAIDAECSLKNIGVRYRPSSRNELIAEQIAEGKKSSKTSGVFAKADSKKKERFAGTAAKEAKQCLALSNQPSIQQLLNRGLRDVTGERAGYFMSAAKSNSVSNLETRSEKGSRKRKHGKC